MTSDQVNHPIHYGGEDNPYEVIKIIEAFNLGFLLGSALKYLIRAGWKEGSDEITDLKKAIWCLNRHLVNAEEEHNETSADG
jgi:hypothetical protein